MNEYTIYFLLILSSIIFQSFWSWRNSKPKAKKQVDVVEALEKAQQQHKEEIRKLNRIHTQTLKKKKKELHQSCHRRNQTIEFLKKKNYALQEKIREDKQTKNLVVIKVLEALKPLDG